MSRGAADYDNVDHLARYDDIRAAVHDILTEHRRSNADCRCAYCAVFDASQPGGLANRA